MRVAKFISSSGLCSRREAERWLTNGRVQVDGNIILSPALNISSSNIITVDGKVVLPLSKAQLWIYYKPLGLICTHNDPQGRPTIFTQLKKLSKLKVLSVGRLDMNTEGLLLLTNNGGLARYLERPENNIQRQYKVRVYGHGQVINMQNQTITIDSIDYNVKSIKLLVQNLRNSWYEVILTEGKNREVRKIFKHFGFEVNRLIRTKYGIYNLDGIQPGHFKEVKIDENYCWQI